MTSSSVHNINNKAKKNHHGYWLLIKLIFVSIGTILYGYDGNTLSYITNCLNTMAVPIFTENETTTIIVTITNSSAGHDSISAFMVKNTIDIYQLTYLIDN